MSVRYTSASPRRQAIPRLRLSHMPASRSQVKCFTEANFAVDTHSEARYFARVFTKMWTHVDRAKLFQDEELKSGKEIGRFKCLGESGYRC